MSKDKKIELCDGDFNPDDYATRFNDPHSRAILNLISVLILGKGFSTIGNGYFASVSIAVITLLSESLSYKPKDEKRAVLRILEIALLIASLAIGILGVLGILQIESKHNIPHIVVVDFAIFTGASFPAVILYLMVLLSFIISVIDVYTMKTSADEKLNGIKVTTVSR